MAVAVSGSYRRLQFITAGGAVQIEFKGGNALTALDLLRSDAGADREQVASSPRYYTLAQARYKAGTDSFLTFLNAQRTLYTARQQLTLGTLSRQANLVTLHRVLGDGWA